MRTLSLPSILTSIGLMQACEQPARPDPIIFSAPATEEPAPPTERDDVLTLPSVDTVGPLRLTPVSATMGGEVTDDGGAPVTERGIVYDRTPNPTILSNSASILGGGAGTGSFDVQMLGLETDAQLHVRAYAINSEGTSYGEDVVVRPPYPDVGIEFQGGTIFYLLEPGDPFYVPGEFHGLIMPPEDQGDAVPWFCSGIEQDVPSAYDDSIGSGLPNTLAIADLCTDPAIAANVCLDLDVNGYDDWYMPSRFEMHAMIELLDAQGIGGYYWSSSMEGPDRAWVRAYVSPELNLPLSGENNVRCIRSF